MSNGVMQINFNTFCALVWDKQMPRSLLGMLGFNQEVRDTQIIAIFEEKSMQKPKEYEYSPKSTNLDSLPLEVVTTIKAIHESHQLSIRQKILQEKSPLIKSKTT